MRRALLVRIHSTNCSSVLGGRSRAARLSLSLALAVLALCAHISSACTASHFFVAGLLSRALRQTNRRSPGPVCLSGAAQCNHILRSSRLRGAAAAGRVRACGGKNSPARLTPEPVKLTPVKLT
jgi:hypothetical protein